MKSILRIALVATGLLAGAGTASAQLEANLGALDDENAVGYLTPLSTALSATMNSSVFKTGHVPKSGASIHLQANIMGVTFDDEDRTYNPSDPVGFQSTESVDAPTVIGDTQAVEQQGEAGTRLWHPGGFDVENFTVAAPQLEIAGFMGTRAIFRWISLDLGDTDLGKLELFGVGVQHSISQYLDPDFPIDLAVGGFYQNFDIGDGLIDTQMFQFMVTGSKQYGVLEPYLGLGFDTFDMKADYTDEQDFSIEVDFEKENNFHLTAGGRLNFQYFMIHGEMNLAAETGFAAGISLGL